MSILEELDTMNENNDYSMKKLQSIADRIETVIGSTECWDTIRLGFSDIELLENLRYIAREHDL